MTIETEPAVADPDEEALRAAVAAGPRPPRASAVSASLTFGWRALLKIKHVPEQLFDVTAFPIMFLLLFTYLFGGALAGSTGEYLQTLLPGILAMTVVFITIYTGVTLNDDIDEGVFDRFRTLPVWQPSIVVGALLGDAVRYTIASTIVVVLGLLLGFRPGGGVIGVLSAVALLLVFSFSLSWVWTALGFVMRTPESLMGVSMLILFPLTFVSNVFVDPETMPHWLEAFVDVNPFSQLVTAMRGLMHGTATAGDIGAVLFVSAVLVVVFGPVTMYLFHREN
ncbi:ABC transporter permease [Halobacteria archaeon AArc-m2/3/4]|uniref:ABC transporter permease n=1 Tax=Natronoglomus mannanivorans TaxID=2979990 RepID=A0AAP2YYY0_9EURY|nr:ABC transporter permease [Halobacteria archaeon AArc-xg1-1]MCU4975677.1 ABC transporter permease [Halobacteria archaeon AArc-m2/3/4]